eukprot:PhF_6_TR4302/c0_g1_i1/m.5805
MRRFLCKATLLTSSLSNHRILRNSSLGAYDPLLGAGDTIIGSGPLREMLNDLKNAPPMCDETSFATPSSDLGHLESPEQDAKLIETISVAAKTLFEKVPLPADPMKAAMMKLPDEEKAEEENEVLIEAVRMRYRMKKEREQMEEDRVRVATKKHVPITDHEVHKKLAQEAKEEQLRKKIARLKAQLAQAESELCVE